ncbi:MAG: NUDIX domain-containing protein [Anaerolineae bacterium]
MTKNHIPVLYAAAGGVVLDVDGGRVLLLIRPSHDEVRLPKGHIKPGESPETAALREVTEESGYDDLEILADLGEQLVVFPLGKQAIRRTEYYFLIQLNSSKKVQRPKVDEEFFPIWVSWDEALEHLTFDAEREWVSRARDQQKAGS